MVSLSTADNALKSLYLGVISEQLNTEINPFLAKIKQTTQDVWGKEIRRVAQYGINGGFGSGSETGDLPTASGNNYDQFSLTLKNLYGTIEISDKAIRASENNVGAFVNLLNAEMEGLLKASSFNFGRMLFGDGEGVLAKVTAVSDAGVVTVDNIKNIVEGMVVDFYSAAKSKIAAASARRIYNVDRTNKTFCVSGEKLTATDVPKDSFLCVQNSYNMELTGLKAIFKNSGKLYGLDRSEKKWLVPYMKVSVGTISDTVIQGAIDDVEENTGSRINFILCSSGVKRAYQEYLNTYKRNVNVLDLRGGYKAISYNGIPIVSDRFCPAGTMYLLNTDDFVLHQLCDWQWLEGENGKILRQVANKAAYTATLVKYADLICTRPCGQAMLAGISER